MNTLLAVFLFYNVATMIMLRLYYSALKVATRLNSTWRESLLGAPIPLVVRRLALMLYFFFYCISVLYEMHIACLHVTRIYSLFF